MFAVRNSFRTTVATAVITTLATVSAPAFGQTQAFKSPPASVTRATSSADEGRRLFKDGQWKAARKAYERAVDDARAHGDYGRDAFDGLADVQFALDDPRGAARTLDELGERAAAFGDPETELTSFYKSALIYLQIGDKRKAALRVPQIKTLVKSPIISEATRQMIAERLAK